ncbi:MAG: hypothetical protein AB7V43_00625 [Acidimicrobiia bacterium]
MTADVFVDGTVDEAVDAAIVTEAVVLPPPESSLESLLESLQLDAITPKINTIPAIDVMGMRRPVLAMTLLYRRSLRRCIHRDDDRTLAVLVPDDDRGRSRPPPFSRGGARPD